MASSAEGEAQCTICEFRFAPFWEKKLPQAAARIFQLKMIHFMVKQSFIKKKIWEHLGKHVFPPLFAFLLKPNVCA